MKKKQERTPKRCVGKVNLGGGLYPSRLSLLILAAMTAAPCAMAAPVVITTSTAGVAGDNGNNNLGGTGGTVGLGSGQGGNGGDGGSGGVFVDGTPGTAGTGGGNGGNLGAVSGGTNGGGGAGGFSNSASQTGGGGGGGGGSGIALSGPQDITVTSPGTVSGGNGGNGAQFNGVYGSGGGGGDGITLTAANGSTITNNAGASISGGHGGQGSAITGAGGSGGDGISLQGDNSTIINAGTISRGEGGYNAGLAGNAISMLGNNNRVELHAGSTITGNVVATGSGNALALGGSANDTFDASTLGAQYQGFTTLEKTGSSIWTLTGDGSAFAGDVLVNGGTLRGGAAGALVNNTAYVVDNGTLDLNGFNLTVSSFSGTGGAVALGTATLTVDQSTNTSYAGAITGAGNLAKLGTGTLSIAGSNTYGGNTKVSAGTLQFDDYTQSASQTLGIGAVSDSAYGKLDVVNTATFAAGSKIAVDVAGINTLAKGETLASVISAGGTLNSSTFVVSDNSALFNFRAVRNGNAVDLQIVANSSSGVYDAVMNNQRYSAAGAARVLDDTINNGATGDMATVVTALGSLGSQGEISRAATQTLPLLGAGVTQVANGVLNSINRLVQNRQSGASGLSGGDDISNRSAWLKPFASRADQDDRDGVSGFKADTWGLVGGIEGDLSRTTRLGIAYGYANSIVDGNTRLSGARQRVDIDSHVLAVYGTNDLTDGMTLGFQGDIGQNSNEGKRHINFGGLDRSATSDYKTYTAHIGVSLAKMLRLNERTSVTPAIRADYTWLHDESYREQGADALNLDVDKRSTDAFVLGADARLSHLLSERSRFEANAGIGYDTINERGNVVASYAGTPGQAFGTRGIDHSPWLVAGGMAYVYNTTGGAEISVRYDVEGRSDYVNQSASVKAKWAF